MTTAQMASFVASFVGSLGLFGVLLLCILMKYFERRTEKEIVRMKEMLMEVEEMRKSLKEPTELKQKPEDLKVASSKIKNDLEDMKVASSKRKKDREDMKVASSKIKNDIKDLKMANSDIKNKMEYLKVASSDMKNRMEALKVATSDLKNEMEDLKVAYSQNVCLWAREYIIVTGGEFIQFLLGRHLQPHPQTPFLATDDQAKIRIAAQKMGVSEVRMLDSFQKMYRSSNGSVYCSGWRHMDRRVLECKNLFMRHESLQSRYFHQYYLIRRAENMKLAFNCPC